MVIFTTLPNVVELVVENGNAFSTLSYVVYINVEKDILDLTLFNVVNFNVNVRNVISTLSNQR